MKRLSRFRNVMATARPTPSTLIVVAALGACLGAELGGEEHRQQHADENDERLHRDEALDKREEARMSSEAVLRESAENGHTA